MSDYTVPPSLPGILSDLQKRVERLERLDLRSANTRAPWTALTLSSGWTSDTDGLSYYKDNLGRIFLRGGVISHGSSNSILTMPGGVMGDFDDAADFYVVGFNKVSGVNVSRRLQVQGTTGLVWLPGTTPAANDCFRLDVVSFRVT